MATELERKESAGGLTFKLYRGEGVALLAFDLDQAQATDDFVGFSIEVRYPGSTHWGALKNRLHFDYPPLKATALVSINRSAVSEIPLDPRANGGQAGCRYRVTACYMNAAGELHTGAQVENAISLEPHTIDGFLNVGFTRGFASSQAYADRFNNEAGTAPVPGSSSAASLEHDMAPFENNYAWLGFEARRMIFDVLDQVAADPTLTLDALLWSERAGSAQTLGSVTQPRAGDC